jgi:hypothetical protein
VRLLVVSFSEYRTPARADELFGECHTRCGQTFAAQRAAIDAVVERLDPRVVACLGAGILNDIPYRSLVERSSMLHLVDWVSGAPDFGVAHSIIDRTDNGHARCIYCQLASTDPRSFCVNYRANAASTAETCDAFVPSPEPPLTCLAFRRGERPRIHHQDVTGGYATAFGDRIPGVLRDVTSWRQALRRALALAGKVKRQHTPLDIPEGSVDLVVSSMVLSQFEHEPYDYFARQTEAMLGTPSEDTERRLQPAVEALRTALLVNQIEGHCQEIERILAPDGRCFIAFEIFHRGTDEPHWRLLETMRDALGLLARHFVFDFADSPDPILDRDFLARRGQSVVYQSLMARKTA